MAAQTKYLSNPDLEFVKKDFKGNININGRFCNSDKPDKMPFSLVFKWMLSKNPQKDEKKQDSFRLKVVKDLSFKESEKDILLWLGHSSFYIRLNGIVYLTDPMFSDLPTGKRKVENPYSAEEFGKVDYILLSHAHFDHLDIPTLEQFCKANPETEILCPLGVSRILKKGILKNIKKQEAGWFQTFKTKRNTVTFLPAKHWNRRGLFDFNKALWGGFAISSDRLKIYFAGDTARAINRFQSINEIYNGFDYCFIPIGAYKPKFMMENVHISPEEAVELFQIVQGKYFIPMHYGTFDLSDEPLGEPIRLLKTKAQASQIEDKLCVLDVGKVMELS